MKQIYYLLFILSFTSCRLYKRDLLFRADKEKEKEFFEMSKKIITPKNYLISKNDLIDFSLVTNKGEILIDPTSELSKQTASSAGAGSVGAKYLVQGDGFVDLPILGRVNLDSLTLHQCDSLLASLYSKYYLDPFVKTKVSSRRVYIVGIGIGSVAGGGSSGGGRVLELDHENTSLMEILSRIGGASAFSFMNRIKIIRGDLKNPVIFTVDITKWNSFQSSNLIIEPNDIIYIEPVKRPVFDFVRDISILTQFSTIILTVILLFRL